MQNKEYWTVTASFVSKVTYCTAHRTTRTQRFPQKELVAFHLLSCCVPIAIMLPSLRKSLLIPPKDKSSVGFELNTAHLFAQAYV